MKIIFKKILKFFLFFIIICVIFGLTLIIWLSSGEFSLAKKNILEHFPFPLAAVNYKIISSKDFISHYETTLKYFNSNSTDINIQNIKTIAYEETINEEILKQLTHKYGIKFSSQQFEREFELIKNQQSGILPLLKKYNLSEISYKEKILKPYLLQNRLKIWFYNQRNLNTQAYEKIEELQKQLNSGSKFEDLVQFSQDSTSRETFGDLGFVETTTLLPEILEVIDEMKYNESKISASRFGLHLMQLLGKDNQGENNSARVHLRQIFIPASNFDEWYLNETKKMKVFKIIKI